MYFCQFCQCWQSATEDHYCQREAHLTRLVLHGLICPHALIDPSTYENRLPTQPLPPPPLLGLGAPRPSPRRLDASQNEIKKTQTKKVKKSPIPKDALEILRDAANSDEKPDQSLSETKTDEPENKLEASKKKPKTHFRKSKKPGRA